MPDSCPQEEEERKAREEQAQREHEEYLKLKEAFVVEEEGVGETMTEEQVGLLPLESPSLCPPSPPPHPRHPLVPCLPPLSGIERWVGIRPRRLWWPEASSSGEACLRTPHCGQLCLGRWQAVGGHRRW